MSALGTARRAVLLLFALGSASAFAPAHAAVPGPTGIPGPVGRSTDTLTWEWTPSTDTEEYQVFLASDMADAFAVTLGTSFTHYALGPNGLSSIVVRGTNATDDGPFSSTASAYSAARPPTALAVSSVTSIYAVLSWSADGNPVGTFYDLHKSSDGAVFLPHSTYAVTGATVAGLSPDTSYYFRLRAYNSDIIPTAFTGDVSTKTALTGGSAPPDVPAAPSPVVLSTAEVSWSWDAVSGATSYRVYLATKSFELLASTPTPGFLHAGLGPNQASGIVVSALNETGEGGKSDAADASTLALPPTGSAVVSAGTGTVTLSWSAGGNPDGTYYEVQKASEGAGFAVHSTYTATSVGVGALLSNTTWQFQVRAANADGVTTSFDVTVTTRTASLLPGAPGAPAEVSSSTGDVVWSWAAAANALSYEVRLATRSQELLAAPTDPTFAHALSPNALSSIIVRAVNADGVGPFTSTVTLHSRARDPANLAVDNVASIYVALSWDADGNPDGTTYLVEKSSEGVAFLPHSTYTVTAATVAGLTPMTTYQFRIRAFNDELIQSGPSGIVSTVTTATGGLPPPETPGNPGFVTLSTAEVSWTWTAAGGADSYEVVLATKTSEVLAAVGTNAFLHAALSPNSHSNILVRGVNGTGSGPFSSAGSGYSWAMAPGSLQASGVGAQLVTLVWDEQGNAASTVYDVEGSTEGGVFALLTSATGSIVGVSGLLPATTYQFRLRAFNGNSVPTAYSGSASTRTLPPPPPAPGLPAALVLSTGDVSWAWAGSTDAASYQVYLATDTAQLLASPATASFVHVGLSPNSASSIVVRGVSPSGTGAFSAAAGAFTLAMAPTSLAAVSAASTTLALSWDAAGNPAGTVYELQRATDGASFVPYSTYSAAAASLGGLPPDTTFEFQVRAYNDDSVATAFSNTAATGTALPLPGQPGTPTLAFVSSRAVTWSWAPGGDTVSFEVLLATKPAEVVATASVSSATLSLSPNQLSSIFVRGLNAAGTGAPSPSTSAYTHAVDPAGLTVTGRGATSVSLSWLQNGNPVGTTYEVQASSAGGPFYSAGSPGAPLADVLGLSSMTAYDFKVRAVNGGSVPSDFSATVSTDTLGLPPGVPGTPTAAYLSTGVVTWSWGAATDAASYEVSLASKTSELLAAPAVSSFTLTVGVNEPSGIVVRGVNAAGAGSLSASASVYTLALPPTGLDAAAVFSTSVDLTWAGGGNPAGTLYRLEASSGGAYVQAAETASLSATASSLDSSTLYDFKVRALNGDFVPSAYSAVFSTETLGLPPGVPGTPSAAYLSTGVVTWSWGAATDAASYQVYLATKTSEVLAAPVVSSFTLTLGVNEPSAIVVRGVNLLGAGPLSPAATVHTLALPPTGLAVLDVTATSADLSWDAAGNPAGTLYRLESSSGGPFVPAGETASLGASLSSLSSSTAYDFRVRSLNGDSVPSAFEGVVSTQTDGLVGPLPGAPGTPVSASVSTGSVSWSWAPAADADSYKVHPASNPAVLLATPAAAAVAFAAMTPNTPSALAVRGVNSEGDGPLSASATAYTLARVPGTPVVLEVHFTSVAVSWDSDGNPAGTVYELQAASAGGNFLPQSTTTATSAFAVSLATDAVYDFQVRAFNEDEVATAFSAQTSTRTLSPVPGAPGTPTPTVLSSTAVSWSWAPAERAVSYQVFLASNPAELRAAPGGESVVLADYSPNSASAIVVRAVNADGTGPLSASATAYTHAAVPTSLDGVAAGSTTLQLVWGAAGNPEGTVYELESSSDGASFFQAVSVATVSASLGGLTPATTYQFRVRALNEDAAASAYSVVLQTGTAPPYPGVPGAPTASFVSTGAVTWAWAAASDAVSYEVFLATKPAELAAAPAVSSFTVLLEPNGRTAVFVRGLNALGAGPLSPSATAHALAMPPSALTVTGVSATSVDLVWGASGNASGTSFHIEKATDGVTFSDAGNTTSADASVVGLASATAHDFRVRAENGDGVFSAYSGVASTQTEDATGPLPGVPGTPSVVFVSTDDVVWTWAGSSDATGYKVFPASSTSALLASPATNTLHFAGVGPNVRSAIVAAGTNAVGDGPLSAAATVHTLAMPPQSLSLLGAFVSSVTLSWDSNGNPGGTVYQVQQSVDGVFYVPFTTTTSSAFAPVSLASSTAYWFRILALNGDSVETAFSNAVATVTLSPLPGPTGTPAPVFVSTREVVWGWGAAFQASSYQVYLATKTSELLAAPSAPVFTAAPGPNRATAIVVRATNTYGAGPLSGAATAYTLAATPTALALTSVSSAAVGLTWGANGNPAGTVYELEASSDGVGYAAFSTYSVAGTTAVALSASTTYFFRVRARNGDLTVTGFDTPVSTTTAPPLPGTPGTPAAVFVSTGDVVWSWTGASDAAGYRVVLASDTAEVLAVPATNSYRRTLGPNEAAGVVVLGENPTGLGPLSGTATAYTLAMPPTGLALTTVSSATVGLTWGANGNPAGTVYELESSSDGVGYAAFSTYSVAGTTASALSASTTYFFRVRARNGDLAVTGFDAPVSTTTAPPLPGTPGTPAAVFVSTGDVVWSWTGASDAAGYRVVLASDTAEVLAAPATNAYRRTLGPNEAAGVAVLGENPTGLGPLSGTATAYTLAMPPTGLALTAVSSSAVGLSWGANGNPTGTVYELEVSSDGVGYAAFSTSGVTGATAAALSASTTYFFRVRARNGDLAVTGFDAPVSTTTAPPLPGTPGTPVAVFVSTGDVVWSWTGASDAAGYRVVLASKTAEVLAAPATNAYRRTLGPNEAAGVAVLGENPTGLGPLSGTATAYTLAMPPTGLALTAVSSATVGLSWGANGNPAGTVYELEASSDGVGYAAFSTSGVTGATAAALSASTTYFFRVRARNGDLAVTAFDTPVSTTTAPPLPGTPGTPAAVFVSTGDVVWSWTGASDAAGYRVVLASKTAEVLAAPATNAYRRTLGPNEAAGVAVLGENPTGLGPLSETATAYTLAMPPTGLALTAVSSSAVGLSWGANGNPAGTVYELEVSSDGVGYAAFSTYSVTGTTAAALSASATYFFRLRARNGDLAVTGFDAAVSTLTLPPAPGQPGTPVGTALGVSSIQWTWSAATDAASYTVFAASSPALPVASPATPSFLQDALPPNTAAGLFVAGVNPSGAGALSAAATAYTLAAPPAASAVDAVHQTSAAVSWSLNGNPAGTTASVERSTDGAAFGSSSATTGTSQTLEGLLVCTSYWFRVRHLNGDGLPSAYDGASFLTRPSTPTPPGGLSAEALAGNRVRLGWTASGSESVVEYRLYWDAGAGAISYAAPLAVVPATMTSHDTGVLASSAAYRFALRAYNRCGIEEGNTAVQASAPSLTALTGVRAAPSAPRSGQRVKGDRLTVAAARTLGEAFQVQSVLFQYKPSSASVWLDIPAAGGNPNPDTSEPYFIHWNADVLGVAVDHSLDVRAVAYDVAGASDSAPSAVTLTLVPAAALAYDVAEGLVGGKVVKVQVLDNNVQATLQTGGSLPASVTVPAGALASSSATLTVLNEPAVVPPPPAGGEAVGSAVQITLSGGQTLLANGRTAAVSLGFGDADGDGVIDGTALRADRLVMYSAETAAGPWVRDFASSVDLANRTVTGNTPHFSFFALFSVAAANLDSVRVYPVPYMPNGGDADRGVPYAAGNPNSGIVFDNLPNSVVIKIYTVTGQRVVQFASDVSGGKVQWDVRNDRGQDVASGGYVAVITSPGASPVTKRILIVR